MFIRVNGKVYGPYNDQQIAQFIKEGRLIPASEVSFDNINWMAASQVPQLFGDSNLPPVNSGNPYTSPQTVSQNYDYGGEVSDPNITFFEAYKRCWKYYSRTSGRARRKEYWAWSVINALIICVMYFIMFIGAAITESGSETLGNILILFSAIPIFVFLTAAIVPGICVLVRRLHDINMSGWLALLCFIPYVGGLIMLIFACIDGTAGPNKFGPDPKGR